ncbi:hypothetical protein BCR35DRAFT_329502 [Leucosporidium creatinivorum]|uniref:Uncharacterized protein n=1 Tax=Leucosporidium creatinivorum TaxID=106004 RepID=A0A1Y2FYC0_9BASI|nr:hypothetical protein BCR35DRAFT_329502 [Leucosporidium creatinivorum]
MDKARRLHSTLLPLLPTSHSRSQEGSQFFNGFGGIGGLCRYKVDFAQIADALDDVDDDEFILDNAGWSKVFHLSLSL